MYFTNNNKEEIYYELRGNISSSKCIVFLNGLSQSTAAWAFMTPYFEKDYKILLVDFIFQGQSYKEAKGKNFDEHANDLWQLVQFLGINEPHIAGISYGSLVAQHYALNYPDWISKLILMATFAHKTEQFKAIELSWKRSCQTGGYSMLLDVMLPFVLGSNYFENPFIPIDVIKESRVGANQDPTALLKLMKATEERPDYRQKIKKIKAKTLIIQGEFDILVKMEMARDVALNIPDSKLEVIKGVGHTLNLEAPKITAELILDFLEHDN